MEKEAIKTFEKIAVIADVVDSKEIEERNDFQMKLKILLESINKHFEEDIAAKFRITMGDEFQGLLHNPDNLMIIVDEINLSLYPIKIRWGFGIGEMKTTSNLLNYRELDGPTYWNARKALDFVKKNNYYGKSLTYLHSSDDKPVLQQIINSLFQLQDTLRISWTYDQSSIIQYLIKEYSYNDFVQKDVAKTLSLSQQRISNVLAATSYKQYAESRKLTEKLLQEVMHYV